MGKWLDVELYDEGNSKECGRPHRSVPACKYLGIQAPIKFILSIISKILNLNNATSLITVIKLTVTPHFVIERKHF